MADPSQLERERAEAHARLSAIIESSDDAIISKSLEGIVMSWNKGAERIFGWTAEEMIGKSITTIIPTERLDEEPRILAQIRSGQRVDHFETIRQRKDGTLIHISVTISPVRDDTGKIIGVSKVARDVTLQKRYQQELKEARDIAEAARSAAEQAKEAAEQANRAKDHFLSVLSHELRTPLTPVLAGVSLLEGNKTLPPQMLEYVRMIRRNVETEARLVDDLLDLTRIARGKVKLRYETLDAHVALRNVTAMLQSEIDAKGLTLAMSLRAKLSFVWADPGRFQQILLNLLSNAVKFTPGEGIVTVRTSNENGSIKIEIADTGVGIEADVLPRLFRPFEQGEQTITRRFGGLGLGLSIVKSLVELHGASVSVSSEGKDKGSVFTIRFGTATPNVGGEAAGQSDERPDERHRVLLVEDHDDTRHMMSLLLASFGCKVTAVANVQDAIAAADRETFDLLLSDIGLPDGSGIDVMKHLRTKNVCGIAVSGFGQEDDIRRSREAGFASHLIKPVNAQALQEALRKVFV